MLSRQAIQGEKNILVFLDKGGNPEVKIDSSVWGKAKLTWKPDPDSDPFEFVELEFAKANAPFEDIVVNDNKITAKCPDVGKPAAEGLWVYKVTVRAGEDEYTTVETSPPDGDRPVIRN
jgi:hypothetical protein